MLRHLCIRLIKKLLPVTNAFFFFQDFKNRLIFTQLDSRNETTYNQSIISKRVITQCRLEDNISGIALLALKRQQITDG